MPCMCSAGRIFIHAGNHLLIRRDALFRGVRLTVVITGSGVEVSSKASSAGGNPLRGRGWEIGFSEKHVPRRTDGV